jgi:1-acyl-sn-glycerol-3-phosphate acyltransferase
VCGPAEPPLRYRLPGDALGAPTLALYLQTLVRAARWLGVAPPELRLLGLLGAYERLSRGQRRWARGVTRALEVDLTVEGLEHVGGGPYIVTPLHESLVDAVLLLHLPLRFAVRREFRAWRLLGPALARTQQVFICPERPLSYRTLLRAGQQPLTAGGSLVIFP